MEKQEILKKIKEKALENRVPILQDPSLDLIMMVLNFGNWYCCWIFCDKFCKYP